MRIIFMGTPDFAVPTLNALVEAGHEIAAVYCQPPRPAGRGKALRASPVQTRAETLGLEVRHPANLKGAGEQAELVALAADVAVVAAYGLILPRPVLDAPKEGCINVHASLLPRWRGAAPIQRAIMAGDEETGVTIMQMEAGLDTGPIRAVWRTPLAIETAGMLTDELAQAGAQLMVQTLANLAAFPPVPQPEEGVTYAAKIEKSEARIDFTRSAIELERQIRALSPSPGAFFEHKGERIKILYAENDEGTGVPGTVIDEQLTIACGSGTILPMLIQRPGRSPMSPEELLRGFTIPAGTILT